MKDLIQSEDSTVQIIESKFNKMDIIKLISQNQKGQFEDDAGNICWYLDDLVKMLFEALEGDE